ncbi:hypothetical protein LTR37_008738 [Vermiconidia calcicola]|uniref:Uncharacterized protein n=1 Tax=Vermiconidia calcicola TaxID=1690605 RepID=A0ACC3N9S8_9PEZI|nr:hypothetical protein LTR37_008738 [Vermiconidia calcicola]
MASPLMDLPRELRDRIFAFVLCSRGSPQLIHHMMRETKLGAEGGIRYSEKVEPAYPPRDEKAGTSDNVKRRPSLKKTPHHVYGDVEFGLDSDEDDEETDSEDRAARGKGDYDSEDDESEDESPFVSKPRHRNSRYKLETLRSLNLALLRVSRQVNDETLPIFYGGVTFILDCKPLVAIQFFKTLPKRAFKSIMLIAFTGEALMTDDCYVREGWSPLDMPSYMSSNMPLYVGPPTMLTPTGAFFAANMLKLTEVYLYVLYEGDEDWYAANAPPEMQMLLAYGRIERLYFLFFGRIQRVS